MNCTCSAIWNPGCPIDHAKEGADQVDVFDTCVDKLIDQPHWSAVGDWIEDDAFAYEVIASALLSRPEHAAEALAKMRRAFEINRGTQINKLMQQEITNEEDFD